VPWQSKLKILEILLTTSAVTSDSAVITGDVFLWQKINKNMYLILKQNSKNEAMFPIIIKIKVHFREKKISMPLKKRIRVKASNNYRIAYL
jgi:hypothetical protein